MMTDTRPPDAELVARYRAGDQAAALDLIDRHKGLVYKVVAAVRIPKRVDRDDLKQVGFLSILKAAAKWSPDRLGPHGKPVKFSTYAHAAILHAVLRELEWQLDTEATADPDAEAETIPDRPPPPDHPRPPGLSRVAESLMAAVLGEDADADSLSKAAKAHGMSIPQAKRILASECLGLDWEPADRAATHTPQSPSE